MGPLDFHFLVVLVVSLIKLASLFIIITPSIQLRLFWCFCDFRKF